MAQGKFFDKAALQKMIIPGIPVTGAVRHVYDSDNPAFSWKAVKATEPLYHRLEVNRLRGQRVYFTFYIKGMPSRTVPEGFLKPEQSYVPHLPCSKAEHLDISLS